MIGPRRAWPGPCGPTRHYRRRHERDACLGLRGRQPGHAQRVASGSDRRTPGTNLHLAWPCSTEPEQSLNWSVDYAARVTTLCQAVCCRRMQCRSSIAFSSHELISTMVVELCSLPCCRRCQARFARSTTWTSRSSVPTKIIGEWCAVATGVGTEDANALSMIKSPYPLAALTISDLLTERSHVVAGGSLHSGQSLRGDQSRRAKMA